MLDDYQLWGVPEPSVSCRWTGHSLLTVPQDDFLHRLLKPSQWLLWGSEDMLWFPKLQAAFPGGSSQQLFTGPDARWQTVPEVSSLWHTFFKEAKLDRLSVTWYQSTQEQLITPITAKHWGMASGEAQGSRRWEWAELSSQTLWMQHPHEGITNQKESPWSNTPNSTSPTGRKQRPGPFYVSARAARHNKAD